MRQTNWLNLNATWQAMVIAVLVSISSFWPRAGNALEPPDLRADLSDDLDLGDAESPGTVTSPPGTVIPPPGTITSPPGTVTPPSPLTPPRPPSPPIPMTSSLTLEYDVDRPGADYRNFDLQGGAEACRDACAGEAQCQAFTYVKPGVQGPSARCWLKQSVPQGGPSSCCVSGVKAGGPTVSQPTIQPPATNCPPGTTLYSGQCVSVGPPPGIPPPVADPSGHPLGMNCPPGSVVVFGQCAPAGPPPGGPPPSGPPPASDPSGHQVEMSCPPGTVFRSGYCVAPGPPPGLPPAPPLGR